jgi:hypothetical protein
MLHLSLSEVILISLPLQTSLLIWDEQIKCFSKGQNNFGCQRNQNIDGMFIPFLQGKVYCIFSRKLFVFPWFQRCILNPKLSLSNSNFLLNSFPHRSWQSMSCCSNVAHGLFSERPQNKNIFYILNC